jgi:glycosyltransferase involved in cell wall biosynthesis
MKVSVIIPTYNYAAYVREAIDSVLAQTVQDFHIVVVDDGSTDETPAILATIHDPRIEVIRTENRGICAACNEGLARARGEFIGFLGADDRWRPEKLERQLRMMDAEPDLVAVMTNFVRFNEKGFYPHDQFVFFPELNRVPTRPTQDGGGFRITGDAFCTLVAFTEFPTWSGVLLFRAKAIKELFFAREG